VDWQVAYCQRIGLVHGKGRRLGGTGPDQIRSDEAAYWFAVTAEAGASARTGRSAPHPADVRPRLVAIPKSDGTE